MEKVIELYAEKNYKKMFREPAGQLKYKFIVPGSAYSNELWDWDSKVGMPSGWNPILKSCCSLWTAI